MNNLKKYAKTAIGVPIFLILYILVLSLLHYFGLMKLSTVENVNFVVMAIIAFIGGFLSGKKASKKGYLEGLKTGGYFAGILLFINIIFFRHFDLYVVLYYLVLVVSSTIGSMIGINLKR